MGLETDGSIAMRMWYRASLLPIHHEPTQARHLFSTKSYLGLVSCRCACLTVVTRETAQVCFILHIAACPPFETPVPLSK